MAAFAVGDVPAFGSPGFVLSDTGDVQAEPHIVCRALPRDQPSNMILFDPTRELNSYHSYRSIGKPGEQIAKWLSSEDKNPGELAKDPYLLALTARQQFLTVGQDLNDYPPAVKESLKQSYETMQSKLLVKIIDLVNSETSDEINKLTVYIEGYIALWCARPALTTLESEAHGIWSQLIDAKLIPEQHLVDILFDFVHPAIDGRTEEPVYRRSRIASLFSMESLAWLSQACGDEDEPSKVVAELLLAKQTNSELFEVFSTLAPLTKKLVFNRATETLIFKPLDNDLRNIVKAFIGDQDLPTLASALFDALNERYGNGFGNREAYNFTNINGGDIGLTVLARIINEATEPDWRNKLAEQFYIKCVDDFFRLAGQGPLGWDNAEVYAPLAVARAFLSRLDSRPEQLNDLYDSYKQLLFDNSTDTNFTQALITGIEEARNDPGYVSGTSWTLLELLRPLLTIDTQKGQNRAGAAAEEGDDAVLLVRKIIAHYFPDVGKDTTTALENLYENNLPDLAFGITNSPPTDSSMPELTMLLACGDIINPDYLPRHQQYLLALLKRVFTDSSNSHPSDLVAGRLGQAVDPPKKQVVFGGREQLGQALHLWSEEEANTILSSDRDLWTGCRPPTPAVNRIITSFTGQQDFMPDFSQTRPYRYGDPARRISSKLSARQGELMVQPDSRQDSPQVQLVIDSNLAHSIVYAEDIIHAEKLYQLVTALVRAGVEIKFIGALGGVIYALSLPPNRMGDWFDPKSVVTEWLVRLAAAHQIYVEVYQPSIIRQPGHERTMELVPSGLGELPSSIIDGRTIYLLHPYTTRVTNPNGPHSSLSNNKML